MKHIDTKSNTKGQGKAHADTKKALTPEEARHEYFPQLGRNLFYRMLRQNRLPNVRFGKRIIIPRAALERWLETCGES